MKKNIFIFAVFLLLIISNYLFSQWVQTNGPSGGEINSLVVCGSDVYVSCNGLYNRCGIYKSSNGGINWNYIAFRNFNVSCLAVLDLDIYAGVSYGQIYRSTNGGVNWSKFGSDFPESGDIGSIVRGGSTYFVNLSSQVYRSTNNGLNWALCELDSNYCPTSCLFASGDIILAGTFDHRLYLSTNCGNNWSKCNYSHSFVRNVISNGPYLFANTDTGIFRSSNNGLNWTYINHNLQSPLNSLINYGTTLYAVKPGLLCISTNNGTNWSTKNLPINYFGNLSFSNQYLFATGGYKIFRTSNEGTNWETVSNGINCISPSSILSLGNYLFATSEIGVSISSNSGLTWAESNNGLPPPPYSYIYDKFLTSSGSYVFVSMYYSGVYRTSNYGANWIPVNNGLANSPIEYLTSFNSKIYATSDSGIFRSTNNGENWYLLSDTLKSIKSMVSLGTNIFAVNGSRVYRSINDGYNWFLSNNGIGGYRMYTLAVSGSDIIAAGNSGFYEDSSIYLSTNNGNNWIPIGQELVDWNFYVLSIKIYNSYIFLASDSGIFLSTNRGTNWLRKDQGFFDGHRYVTCLETDNNYIYVGVNFASVWRRQLSEIIGIQNISTEIPEKFYLFQNYPNPFNPSTNIRYQIANNGFVSLKIYDILGREISTLVNENQKSGIYEIQFSANSITNSQLSSGIYFYKLVSEDFSETKRMALLK